MIRKALFISLSFVLFSFAYSQAASNSASVANRRTAIRYLQLSKQYATQKQWAESDSNAGLGLAYDDTIADLWYLRAVSKANSGEKKAKVLPLVEKALTEGEWVDYNRDGARVLYADLLCDTRKFNQVLPVLNSEPFIYSADAEYIRAKCYYALGDQENIEKARSKIDSARRVYPTDVRFANLFYAYEYIIYSKTNQISPEAQKLSDAFVASLPFYKNLDSDTEICAAIFCSDKNKRERMFRSFNARNLSSPLYAVAALKDGLLDEQKALDYLYKFADDKINFSILKAFIPLLKNEDNKKELQEYLNSYNGTILFDTDSDLIINMIASYKRGRAEKVSYDENQDDETEWSAECDFGVPLVLHLSENATDIFYSNWPYISRAVYKMGNDDSDRNLTFNLVAETLSWSPFAMKADDTVSSVLSLDFFIPDVVSESKSVSGEMLLRSALDYEIPSSERENAVINVSLLNGVPQIASYSVNKKIYAVAHFKDGIPVTRSVDTDGDEMFETVESYGFTSPDSQNFVSKTDEMQIMTNLFGSPDSGSGIYVKMIQVDRNGDTIPDFTEEYTDGKGKISSWDLDADGNWDVRYVKYPYDEASDLIEDSCFHQPLSNSVVTVTSKNGIPFKVTDGDMVMSVSKGNGNNFYWIGETGTLDDEKKITSSVNQIREQGVSLMVENKNERFLSVRIGKMIFGEKILSSDR